jgi:hypothetical protein
MTDKSHHTFHIPVMGLAFTIDTPVKLARFGISSVVSIVDDLLLEQMREFYCRECGEAFIPIPKHDIDHRAKRITAYLDLLQRIVNSQMEVMRNEDFEEGADIVKYFTMLPDGSPLKSLYGKMERATGSEKESLRVQLRNELVPGAIDVNIMTKVDNLNYSKDGELLPAEYSDASAALRGFANSTLSSSVVFSAGMNPRLFSILETLPDFFPDPSGVIKKKIILKVSDYRSAMIQGKFLAKKGLWVSEFRVESGLNCGGHAFATEGFLLGPILEEFREKRDVLQAELQHMCNDALRAKGLPLLTASPEIRLTVQGGIGTHAEDQFLRRHYRIDSTGWGSPFLLVPEATNVDNETLKQLATARQEDYYLSHASPLGIPFNNFRKSSSELQRKERVRKNRPGSPCYKKHLTFNTEFTERPVCTASREYQEKKIRALEALPMSPHKRMEKLAETTEKDCLCEGLAAAALLKNGIKDPHKLEAVTICPGPNLAFFSGVHTLHEMIGHIYGRANILNDLPRPHMFVNELKMYVDYLDSEIARSPVPRTEKQERYFSSFRTNLIDGIAYYKNLLPEMAEETAGALRVMEAELCALEARLPSVHAADSITI